MKMFSGMAAALLAAAAMAALASPASAAKYVLTFDPTDSTIASDTFDVTTSNVANLDGSFDITSFTGSVGADKGLSLVSNPNAPNISTSADGLFYYDNDATPNSTPVVDNSGVLFGNSLGAEYNLFSDDSTHYELYQKVNGSYGTDTFGSVAISAVPEPTVWAMMLGGMALMGLALRMGRKPRLVAGNPSALA
jgi:hypothetical protein